MVLTIKTYKNVQVLWVTTHKKFMNAALSGWHFRFCEFWVLAFIFSNNNNNNFFFSFWEKNNFPGKYH